MQKIRILIFGDSHTHAFKRALKDRSTAIDDRLVFEAYRYSKIKNGKEIGDLSPEDVIKMVSSLERYDMVVSTIGGNQHQTLSLIQHPVPFDLCIPDSPDLCEPGSVDVIPYAQMWDVFERSLRGKDGTRLQQLREAAHCEVLHLTPPPPKENTAYLKRFESDFISAGILEKGVSPAPLRLKMWQLQANVLRELTAEWGVKLLPPPEEAVDPKGYLEPAYYADDATHANAAYGTLVLKQIERLAFSRDLLN